MLCIYTTKALLLKRQIGMVLLHINARKLQCYDRTKDANELHHQIYFDSFSLEFSILFLKQRSE